MASSEPTPEVKRRISHDIASREAIKAAQAALGVTADGVFGVATLAAVLALVTRCKRYEDALDIPHTGTTEGPRPNA
jgi:hypothetical protein